MAPKILKDPVQGESVKGAVATLDNFEPRPVKPEAAKTVRPFDGYPLKAKIKVGETEVSGKIKDALVSASFIVVINPTFQVRQDPSNRRGIKNYHSRSIRDYENQDNVIVVFDREIELKGKKYLYAVVPQHSVRAQLIFKYDQNKQRIEVCQDYLLLDTDQDSRLKKVFEQIINPKLKVEREASFISGESTKDAGESEPLTENEV
ncbi:MAG: hypothetical protein ABFD76_15320 [Smithella sp.]